MEQEQFILPEHLRSPPVLSGVRVTRSLVLCVCFVDRCLSFCTFSVGHCVVCSSSIYDLLIVDKRNKVSWTGTINYITIICVWLCIVVYNTYCVVFLLCLSSSCVPYFASFSGLSISDCPFGILWRFLYSSIF
jgi:hypothetical protein